MKKNLVLLLIAIIAFGFKAFAQPILDLSVNQDPGTINRIDQLAGDSIVEEREEFEEEERRQKHRQYKEPPAVAPGNEPVDADGEESQTTGEFDEDAESAGGRRQRVVPAEVKPEGKEHKADVESIEHGDAVLDEGQIFKREKEARQEGGPAGHRQPAADKVKQENAGAAHEDGKEAPAEGVVPEDEHAGGDEQLAQRGMLAAGGGIAGEDMTGIVDVELFIEDDGVGGEDNRKVHCQNEQGEEGNPEIFLPAEPGEPVHRHVHSRLTR